MSQHCQRDITNTPSRPMKLLGCPRVPRAVSNPPPDPWQAGHKSQELAVSIPGNVLGNIAETRVLCHAKKSGSMKSSWELFLSAVGNHVNKILVPRNFLQCSQELVQKFPGKVLGNYFSCSQVALFKQDRGWDLFVEKI